MLQSTAMLRLYFNLKSQVLSEVCGISAMDFFQFFCIFTSRFVHKILTYILVGKFQLVLQGLWYKMEFFFTKTSWFWLVWHKIRGWCHQAPDSETLLMPVSSVPHVSDRLELLNNNWASGSQHPGPSESDVVQEARSNELLHTVRLSVHLDTPLHGNNARGAKYSVVHEHSNTHSVRKYKMAALSAVSA